LLFLCKVPSIGAYPEVCLALKIEWKDFWMQNQLLRDQTQENQKKVSFSGTHNQVSEPCCGQ
jgi:hypothetical protein